MNRGKVAMVTGAAQGIGRAISQRWLEQGGSLLAVDVQAQAMFAKVC